MQFVKDLSIRVKLLGGFAVVVALLAVVAVISVMQLNSAADRADTLYSHDLVAVQQSLLTNQGMSASGRDEKQAFLTEDKGQRATWIAQSRKELDDAEKAMEAYHTTFRDEGDRTEWAAIEAKVNPVVAARRQTLTLLEQGNDEAAARNAATVAGQIGEMNKALNELAAKNAQGASDAEEAGASATDTARVVLIAVSVFAALVAAGVGFWLARYIATAAGQATVAAQSIARGNVNVSMSLNSRDEMGQLARSFGEMTEYLKGMVGVAGAIAQGDLSNQVHAKGDDDACGNAFGEMTTYLKEMVGVATAVAGGDLTAEVRSRGANDALGNALASMLDGLRGTVGEVRENASNILSASTQLREASDQMAGATGQIATAINDVTRSAVSLASLSQDSAREVERVAAGSQQLAAAGQSNASLADQSKSEAAQMGERISVVATASQQVATAAEASRDAARTGQDAVTQAVSSMEAIARAVEHASSTVNLLGEYGQQIGDIVKAIDEIAAQTNLLALNAAIEAARAGEQGRGFAVVAENVRTLAERSSDSTKEIAALIARVQSGTQEAVQAMAAGVADVQEGREITAKAGHALASIIEQVQQSAVQMERIAGDVQNLATGAERIVTSAETIAASADQSARGADEIAQGTAKVSEAILQVSATSEETSASAEEVSAATEELSAQSEELAATAGEMKSMAEALARATTRFRLA